MLDLEQPSLTAATLKKPLIGLWQIRVLDLSDHGFESTHRTHDVTIQLPARLLDWNRARVASLKLPIDQFYQLASRYWWRGLCQEWIAP